MAKVKKVDEAAALAEQMLDSLRARRSLGPGDYPPTLRLLAESCGVSPEDSRVLKAIAKKTFTQAATAKLKASDKVNLDSAVYLKEDVPEPVIQSKAERERLKVVELAERMRRVIESQRGLGEDAYPTTLARLAELCDLRSSNTLVTKAATHEAMATEVTFANGGKPASDAPVILNRDLDRGGTGWNSALLNFAFGRSRVDKGKTPKLAFTPKQLATKLQQPIRKSFEDDLIARIGRHELPAEYAWLCNKEPLLFRLDDLQTNSPARKETLADSEPSQPVPPAPARDFAEAFRNAFDRLDRRNGLSNNVKLVDLRRELADFAREHFDAGLRQLRVDREFSLDSHEGLLRSLTIEERDAGITEAGSLLVYVSRR